ncbi:MAG: hypothetical protein M1835_001024 [Candelina submexicana]|nr:MAG: hypothetical protein M1835_001024 [Candelina submexicana]
MSQQSDESDEDEKQSTTDGDEDPVVRQYDIYITPEIEQKLLLLQYPNRHREQPYTAANNARPLEVRMKPDAGLVEVDVPLNIHANYDREKGIRWGEAMRKSNMEKDGGAYGLAAGFGIGSTTRRTARVSVNNEDFGSREASQEALLANFDDANNKGRVLNKQTLGGQLNPNEGWTPNYFIGAFRGNELHLSRLDHIAQLRPQFPHIDALTDQEKSSARAQRENVNQTRLNEPRAVQMTVKSADGDDLDMGETSKLLRAAQEEKWQRLKYLDEDSNESWAAYHQKLFLEDTQDAPRLTSNMTNAEYLNAISAPRTKVSHGGKKEEVIKEEVVGEVNHDSDVIEV